MRYDLQVYSGPPGTEAVPPMEKERWLYKEFGLLDEAFGWARHVNDGGRVALLIEGDDGTQLSKRKSRQRSGIRRRMTGHASAKLGTDCGRSSGLQ